MLMSFASFGQKQKELSAQIDTLTVVNRSLSDSIQVLSYQLDSVSAAFGKYFELYTVIKEKVVLMDFNPDKMGQIIDSLRSGRDSIIHLSEASVILMTDSVNHVNQVNDSLRKEVELLQYAVNLIKGERGAIPNDSKDFSGPWKLVLRKMRIAGDSPRSGIVDASNEPVTKTTNFLESNSVTAINFVDSEFAELSFSNGEEAKCYFLVNEFSKTKPYSIDFKGAKADFKMYFMHTSVGLHVSFQIPNVDDLFYIGEMYK